MNIVKHDIFPDMKNLLRQINCFVVFIARLNNLLSLFGLHHDQNNLTGNLFTLCHQAICVKASLYVSTE